MKVATAAGPNRMAAAGGGLPDDVDWTRWAVVLLKPDCIDRGLETPILQEIRERGFDVVAVKPVRPTWAQLRTFYAFALAHAPSWTALGLRMALCDRRCTVALVRRDLAVPHMNALIGQLRDTPGPESYTIRSQFGRDSPTAALAEGRPVEDLLDCSAHERAVRYDFLAWFGAQRAGLLTVPAHRGCRPPRI